MRQYGPLVGFTFEVMSAIICQYAEDLKGAV